MTEVELSPSKKKVLLYSRLSSAEEIRNNTIQIVQYIEDELEAPKKVYREIILITISLFMGYASLVCLQKKLYNQWESNLGSTLTEKQKQLFEHGTSLIYCLVVIYFVVVCFRTNNKV